ncbi:hypothetical protein BDF20DRAFT_899099 [Mycotypha africana]|uniref:uncharacterized protein n=1 Tax=Mycotypha africana TaxID=64632 RepID=UPI00230167B4|nr:uncharacterized protein BDF20DRAFT_899099 [Mycotypha africana]KAI8967758.1 hypothetical protein BDF20DRAFT_899099 [Mycotypha africana]
MPFYLSVSISEYDSPTLSSEHQLYHSRSPSESSTARLAAPSNTLLGYEEMDTFEQQDPYAAPRFKKKNKHDNNGFKKRELLNYRGIEQQQQQQQQQQQPVEEEKRANSYLPYSNHPYSNHGPVYLQDDSQQAANRGPVGSMLQDNIVMDMLDESYYPNTGNGMGKEDGKELSDTDFDIIPVKKKKKPWWIKLGISGRKLVFIAFAFVAVVAVLWYFVWPRDPTLQFLEAGLADGTTAHYTSTSMEAIWSVNFTVLNSDNWIPTNIQNFAVSVIEDNSGETFGTGNSGHLMLKPRSIDQVVSIPIYINFTRSADNQALKTLLGACSVINQDLASPVPRQSLSITFRIVYYIAGIVWHTVSNVSPISFFQCP